MIDQIYEAYIRYRALRILYQLGFLVAWAIWANRSLNPDQGTGEPGAIWLVFGWLPAVFWPIELLARVMLWAVPNYAALFG